MNLNNKLLPKIFAFLVVAGLMSFGFVYFRTSSNLIGATQQNPTIKPNIEYYAANSSNINPQISKNPQIAINKKIKLPILMYHHIDTVESIPNDDKVGISLRVSPSIFEKQLQYLQKNKYNSINSFQLKDYLDGKIELPSNPVMLTFDDGYKDNYANAFPLLQKYKTLADFAIITSVVGQSEYMSWENLRELKNAGMSFASHTDHHCTTAIKNKNGSFEDSRVDLAQKPCSNFGIQEKLTTGQIQYEFEKSKKELEQILDIRVSHLVYPMGFYNQQAMEIAKTSGYSFATTVKPQKDNLADFTNPFEIGRWRVGGQQSGSINGFFYD